VSKSPPERDGAVASNLAINSLSSQRWLRERDSQSRWGSCYDVCNIYHVRSLDEILEYLRPRRAALGELKKERRQFDPFRGRGHRGADTELPLAARD
jgi:hypothetical protein